MRTIFSLALVALAGTYALAQDTTRVQVGQRGQTNVEIAGSILAPRHMLQTQASWALVNAINSCQSQLANQGVQEGQGQATDRNPFYTQQFTYSDQIFQKISTEKVPGNEQMVSFLQSCSDYFSTLKKFTTTAKKSQIGQVTSLNNAVIQAISANELWSDPNCKQVANDMLVKSWSQIQSITGDARTLDPSLQKMTECASNLVASISKLHGIDVQAVGQAKDDK